MSAAPSAEPSLALDHALAADTPYDEVPYPASAFPQTHPANSEVLAGLRGLQAPPADACRMLELGCGSGGNLIPLAEAYPGSTFLGLDLSSTAVAEGRRAIAALGLKNVVLEQADILTAGATLESYDYIVAHGVYSWVPPAVREAIFSIFAKNLAPNGVAYVSYNCLPRSHVRNIARDLMTFHTRDMHDPAEKVAQARAILRFVADATDEREIYGFTLRDLAGAVEERPGEVLYHDDLNPNATPFLVSDVLAAAARHGLQFLCEASSPGRLQGHLEPMNAFLDRIPDEAVAVREQYLDFFLGRGFRHHPALPHRRAAAAPRAGDGGARLSHRLRHAARGRCGAARGGRCRFLLHRPRPHAFDGSRSEQRGPPPSRRDLARAIAFDDLVGAALDRLGPAAEAVKARLPDEVETLAGVIFQASTSGSLILRRRPPPLSPAAGPRPAASLVARRQAMTGEKVINRLHRSVALTDPMIRRFVQLLDGTRDIDDLVADLGAEAQAFAQAQGAEAPPVTRAMVENNLRALGRLALLVE